MLNDARWSVQMELYLPNDFEENLCLTWGDVEAFLHYWLRTDCDESDWCDELDIDQSGKVDLVDFALFSQAWLLCY